EAHADLGQDRSGRLHQNPPHLVASKVRVALDGVASKILQLAQRLDPPPASPPPRNPTVGAARRRSPSSVTAAMSSRESTWLRSQMASWTVLKPTPCPARPGMRSTRAHEA